MALVVEKLAVLSGSWETSLNQEFFDLLGK